MSIHDDLAGLSAEALRDVARNGSAREEYRIECAKKLAEMHHRYAKDPVIFLLSHPYSGEYGAPVLPSEEPEPEPSVFQASVTTETLRKSESEVPDRVFTSEEAESVIEFFNKRDFDAPATPRDEETKQDQEVLPETETRPDSN